jgi:hypothetical protein
MRLGNLLQFVLAFGKRDVQAALSRSGTLHQELQRECCLAGSWLALDQMYPVRGIAAVQNSVEAINASGDLMLLPLRSDPFMILSSSEARCRARIFSFARSAG